MKNLILFSTSMFAATSLFFGTTSASATDCNQNGLPDGSDTASGRAIDANQDGIPDSCESGVPLPVLRAVGANIGIFGFWTTAPLPGIWDVWISRSDDFSQRINGQGVSGETIDLRMELQPGINTIFGWHDSNVYGDSEVQMGLWFSDSVAPEVSVRPGDPAPPWAGFLNSATAGAPATQGSGLRSVQVGTWIVEVVSLETSFGGQLVGPESVSGGGSVDRRFKLVIGVRSSDTDGDGISGTTDNCPDVANPDQRDCNGNGIGEACETFTDCNGTLIPDSCDIASGTSSDADANGVPDECQPDCNMNDLPDAFEIATSLVSDLNNDAIPDDCQGARMVRLESANLGAPSGEVARVWTADELLLSETAVTITIDLRGDLNGQTEWVDVVLNDSAPRRFFEADGGLCPATPDRATITLPRAEFNDLIGDGRLLTVRVQCPPTVDATECKNDGLTIVSMSYVGIEPKGDCNGNERLDVVEVVDGTTPDCNSNKVPDSCDIARGAESDCNLNGIPDSCEVASDPTTDCNGNLRPDTCDVASGTSADRDGNLRPDECQTVTVPGEFATIQQAIDTAPTNDMRIIAVAAGIHGGPVDFRGKPIVVRGAGAGTTVIQGSAGQQSSVVRFMSGEPAVSALERVTVKGGATGTPLPNFPSALAGGGILGIDAATSIRECVIESNGAGFGGGAYLLRCSGEVRQCTFRNNTASTDGGGLQMNLSTGSVIDCVIEQNSANSRGGGLHLVQGTPTLARVSVNGNVSNNLMGGLSWFSVGSPQALLALDDCVVTNNTALISLGGVGITDSGGAVASMTIAGSTICSNAPRPNIGGGRWSNLGDNSICDCTADLTFDGIVDGVDLAALLSQWGSSGGGAYPADIDGSGTVDGGDLSIVLGGWGPCPQ